MNDMDLKDAFAEAIARRAAEIVLADLEKTKRTDYDPTRRLSRHEAARHLGISVRTLDARVAAGLIRKRCPDGQRPYYLMGELDGIFSHKKAAMCAVFLPPIARFCAVNVRHSAD